MGGLTLGLTEGSEVSAAACVLGIPLPASLCGVGRARKQLVTGKLDLPFQPTHPVSWPTGDLR